jgi:hypothetical protein
MALLDDRKRRENMGLSPLPDNWGPHGLDGRAIAKEVQAHPWLPGPRDWVTEDDHYTADTDDSTKREIQRRAIKRAGLAIQGRSLTDDDVEQVACYLFHDWAPLPN